MMTPTGESGRNQVEAAPQLGASTVEAARKPSGRHAASRWKLALLALALAGAPTRTAASAGDADPAYRACLSRCQVSGRADDGSVACCAASDAECPLALRWTLWDCAADCSYHCMQHREAANAASGRGAFKYHGKWAFSRVLGMQEPASVVASVLNLGVLCASHLRMESNTWGLRRGRGGGHIVLWRAYTAVSINAWVWSAVFHARDTRPTEAADYVAADTLLAFYMFASLVRTLSLGRGRSIVVGLGLAAGLAAQVHYLLWVEFDYGWNVKLGVACGLLQAIVWAVWAAVSRHPARYTLWSFIVAVNGAMLLEVLDFPPLAGVLDAHAAWHFATAALTPVWFRFLEADLAHEAAVQSRRKE